MTDNEKRAHDLAAAMVLSMINLRMKEIAQSGETNIIIDIYHEYMKIYNSSLESFNRDFPD
jgi:hypothetical protein